MSIEQVKEIEANIRELKKIADVGEALNRLQSNRDFKKVFTEGYFSEEAVRLVHLKAAPNFESRESQASINSQIDAIGNAAQYLHAVAFRASTARKAIDSNNEELDLIAEEEAKQ